MAAKAMINGIEVKGLKCYEGVEGPTYQGNLYIGSKKVAFWSQDSYGGIIDWLDMEPGFSEEKLRNLFFDEDKNMGLELAMDKMVRLKERLKEYKKAKKEGFEAIFVLSGDILEKTWYISTGDKKTKDELKEELLPGCKKEFRQKKDPTAYLYSKDEDFIIGNAATLDDIRI